MITGLGTDIVDVPAFGRRYDRGTLARAFSEQERAYAESLPRQRFQILAARWAAKEAFAKALGSGLRAEWPLQEIEVIRRESGKPDLRIGPNLSHLLPPDARIHLSLSHSRNSAIAVVIIET